MKSAGSRTVCFENYIEPYEISVIRGWLINLYQNKVKLYLNSYWLLPSQSEVSPTFSDKIWRKCNFPYHTVSNIIWLPEYLSVPTVGYDRNSIRIRPSDPLAIPLHGILSDSVGWSDPMRSDRIRYRIGGPGLNKKILLFQR